MSTFTQGPHRLTLYPNRDAKQAVISLSKGGFIQATFTPKTDDHFAECTDRLSKWYDTYGEDFLADASFVRHIQGV